MTRSQGRRRYLFRLDVTYPPGSRTAGWMPPNWRDLLREGWNNTYSPDPDWLAAVSDDDLRAARPFRWPRARLLLTREHALRKADLLRRAGALVNVVRSLPVVWPDDSPAEVRAAPKQPDTPLAGLEALR